MKKILVIQSNDLLRDYLSEKCQKLGFETYTSKDGFEGMIKIKNLLPDLIIMDLNLTRLTGLELLKEKNQFKSSINIPVLLISANNIDRETFEAIIRYKVFKILYKPIKIDLLIKAIAEATNEKLEIDDTTCMIDVHLNTDILFIEIAGGLNLDKIELLKYRIIQIINFSKIKYPKVLIILTDIKFAEDLGIRLTLLLNNITESILSPLSYVKILSSATFIRDFLSLHDRYKTLEFFTDFTKVMDSLGKIDHLTYGEELDKIKKEILENCSPVIEDIDVPFSLKFDTEVIKDIKRKNLIDYKIAIIDDDLYVLEYIATVLAEAGMTIFTYDSGRSFLNDLKKNLPDLIILDLMMPEMNGYELIQHLQNGRVDIPIIVISALIDKESIIKAKKMGITHYLTKPLKADLIINKVKDVLKLE